MSKRERANSRKFDSEFLFACHHFYKVKTWKFQGSLEEMERKNSCKSEQREKKSKLEPIIKFEL